MSDINLSEQSTKEEVADFFVKNFKISEESKNNFIKEDISGDVLSSILDQEFKSLGLKIGPLKKVQKYLNENKQNFKEKEINEVITSNSNSEEVTKFFQKCLNFKQNLDNLDGKGLIELDEEGMKKLGLNIGQRKKLLKYIEYFKTIPPPPPEEEEKEIIISKKSSEEDVAKFLKMRLKFSQDSIDALGLDGESLYLLEGTEVDGYEELTQEERENLKKFLIEAKNEGLTFESKPETEPELIITDKSSSEEVSIFLKKKFGFKDESIKEMELDGESLFLLEGTEIDEFTVISQEEKDKLKKFLYETKNKDEPIKNITKESNKNEVASYLKEKLNFTDKSIKELNLDGNSLFSLKREQIEKLKEINEDEKNKLKAFLNVEKNITDSEREKIEKREKEEKEEKEKEEKEKREKIEKREKDEKEEKEKEEKEKREKEEKEKREKEEKEKEEKDEKEKREKEEKDKKEKYKKEKEEKEEKEKREKEEKDKSSSFQDNNNNLSDPLPANSGQENPIPSKNKEKDGDTNDETKDSNIINIDINLDEQKEIPKTQILKTGKQIINDAKSKMQDKKMDKINKKKINDPLSNIVIEERVEKEEKKSKKKQFFNFENYKIKPMDKKSKYNIFFPFIIQEKYIKKISLAIFNEEGYLYSSYINYDFNLLLDNKKETLGGVAVRYFIIQVPLIKPIKNLSITLLLKNNYNNNIYKEEFNETLIIKKANDNYFYINNFTYDSQNDFVTSSLNTIFSTFLSYFFDKKNDIEPICQKSLLEALLDKIYYYNRVELGAINILKFFKFCSKYKLEIKKVDIIEVMEERKNNKSPLNPEYCLLSEDIDNLILNKQRYKFIQLIVYIYALYDKQFLMILIESKDWIDYCRAVFDLINNKKLKLGDLSFQSEKELKLFQKKLLSVSNNKEEINYTIKIIKGFTNSLIFIKENCYQICSILEENSRKLCSDKTNYLLTLNNLTNEDNDIDEIYNNLQQIIKLKKDKSYKIINLEDIFEKMINFFSNKELNEFCKLHNIVGILKGQKINSRCIEYFYNKVHQRGMNLIRNNKLTPKEIITFILAQDIYYYNPILKNNYNRDPTIFSYIPITDKDKNYLNNIKLIKEKDLWNIFSESDKHIRTKFHETFLDQMTNIKDFKSIFDIFPRNYFDKDFTNLINKKIAELIYTALDESENNYNKIFQIFDNWFIINEYNSLDLTFLINHIEINYKLTSKYYLHLLKSKEMLYTAEIIKGFIIKFFMKQNEEGNNNAESLIALLLCNNNDLCLYFLNELNNKRLKEEDFYQLDETDNFLLFKLFFQKCLELLNNPMISQGYYIKESLAIKSKIFNDLNKNEVKYNIVNNLMDENKRFYKKMLVITDKYTEKIYNNLKKSLQICKNKFDELENIEDY